MLTHLDDALMTDQEIRELPKVWVVGGDGALGDIGFQNVSKVILQNRPNIKMLMLDTQVYSNTGGQNSDSSTMLGGYDMNQFGIASQGKLIEKKNVAEAFTSGHGSPFVAQVSMANAAKLYKAMLDGLEYRGTAFFQAYTTCQPEHSVADNMSAEQAKLIRDGRGMPEFVFQSAPRRDRAGGLRPQRQSHAHARLVAHQVRLHRRGIQFHRRALGADRGPFPQARQGHQGRGGPRNDSTGRHAGLHHAGRRDLPPHVRSQPPQPRARLRLLHQGEIGGKMKYYALSRQMVLFAVERRKAWRMLQSKAGVVNKDYLAQKALLAKLDKGELRLDELQAKTRELFEAEVAKQNQPTEKAA
jgi:pyruvate-ferredoxin/flavodoxin oxidoreductase